VRLAGRVFLSTSLLLAATVGGLIVAAEQLLRRNLESEIAIGLEHEARLLATLLPSDSSAWPDVARRLGQLVGHRVTLIDPKGRVRGDTEFDRDALARLENHAERPEVRQALVGGVGHDQRVSASTNERRLYVAVRGGPPGLAIVRLSTTFRAVDQTVGAVQRGVAVAGIAALAIAALLAWTLSATMARHLMQLGDAARAIAAGAAPVFPDSRIPEVAEHVLALRAMHEQLVQRFTELQREREETHTLIESMADGLLATDAAGNVATVNAAARRLLSRRGSEPLPPVTELFHDKRAREIVRAALAGREFEQTELDLEGRALLVTSRPLPNGGALLVFRDVTALRRLEAVRRDFVANVSHELKTPLTSIAGYAETLAAEERDSTQALKFANTILSNAHRMQRLVDDLLDLSRIESGGWQPMRRVVDVAALAQEAWTPFSDRAREQEVRFTVDIAPEAETVVADLDGLRQILTNLFDNALRYTPAGGEIAVRAGAAPDGIVIAVSDTGTGIAPQHLPRIFERFYRADASRSRAQGGTGLGLAIVKHLVEAHGGRVAAESSLGRGTIIRLFFPAEGGSS
jgi:two-component system, OmpR family, phosphate regulon sensor histidine kinase PhoR